MATSDAYSNKNVKNFSIDILNQEHVRLTETILTLKDILLKKEEKINTLLSKKVR